MTADIAAIRARIAAATPGPWKGNDQLVWAESDLTGLHTIEAICGDDELLNPGGMIQCPENADLIADAPTDLAALCDEVEALRQTLLQRTAERDFHITEVDELSAKLEDFTEAASGARAELDDNCRALGHALTQEIRRRDQAEAELELLREELARTRTVASDE